MTHVVSEWAVSRFPIYKADDVRSLYCTSNRTMRKLDESTTTLVVVAGGTGAVKFHDDMHELAEGTAILIPARSQAALMANRGQPLHVYQLSIGVLEQGTLHGDVMPRRSEVVSITEPRFFPNEPAIANDVEQLYVHRMPDSEARHMRNQMLFHHILLQLLERLEVVNAGGEHPSLERSIAYMENHYRDKITRARLAEIAGVSQSHYSILFKQLTGFSPNEYLSRLRVHRAKELLIGGSSTLREIAQKVGYKDEFYLSRRFKQQTGSSPSSFGREPVQRVAVYLAPYASHLMTLGLEPAVTIAESGEYVSAEGVQTPQTMRFLNANASPEQVKTVLLANEIEVIIAANQHLQQYGLNPDHLRAVAPVVEISWMDLGWKDHLRLIAKAVQRGEHADRWLEEFESEERAARSRVKQSAAADETVTILVLKPGALLVYGARNVGCVIYQSLGLHPPKRIAERIDRLGERFHSVKIDTSELADYEGTRLLVITWPDDKGSTAHTESIFASQYWNKLDAVRHNRVHLLDRDEWIPYNPVSIRSQLQRAVALFTTD